MRSSKAPPNQKNKGQVLPHPSEPSLRASEPQRSAGVFRHFRPPTWCKQYIMCIVFQLFQYQILHQFALTRWLDNHWTDLSTAFMSRVEVLNQLEVTVIPPQYDKVLQPFKQSMIRD